MKLVIDIPEEEYEFCKKQWDTECLDILTIAVKYGIPLSNIIDTLDEMDLADYDYHTIQAIKQILNEDEATH